MGYLSGLPRTTAIQYFYTKTKIANYADDSTTYTSEENIESLLKHYRRKLR